MQNLSEAKESIYGSIQESFARQAKGTLIVKVAFAALSAISGICQFTTSQITMSSYIGISSSFVAFCTALYITYLDKDSSAEMEKARKAISTVESARDNLNEREQALKQIYNEFDDYESDLESSKELYLAMKSMTLIAQSLVGTKIAVSDAIRDTLISAERSLKISIGFKPSEYHTITIYRATEDESHRKFLKCIAHSRTVDCRIEDARVWPLGVGVGGAAFARGQEVVVPDMTDISIGSLYSHNTKAEDQERYKSIAAVPVKLSPDAEPWGVVIGTSDRPGHFSVGPDDVGVQTTEAIRALAGMVALVAKIAGSADLDGQKSDKKDSLN